MGPYPGTLASCSHALIKASCTARLLPRLFLGSSSALASALPRISLLRRAMDMMCDLCPFAAAFSTRRARWLRVPIQGLWRHVLMPLLRLVAPLGSCLGSSSALPRLLLRLFLGSPSFGERWT